MLADDCPQALSPPTGPPCVVLFGTKGSSPHPTSSSLAYNFAFSVSLISPKRSPICRRPTGRSGSFTGGLSAYSTVHVWPSLEPATQPRLVSFWPVTRFPPLENS